MGEGIRADLKDALKTAMKEKDEIGVTTLRLVLAAIKDRDIAARVEDRCGGATEDEILQLLTKMVKQRTESATVYEEAGRLDLAEQERKEMAVINGFLPQQLDESEIKEACGTVIEELGASGLKDMGKCMGALKERYTGSMDFTKASAVVKQLLKSESAA